MSDLDPSGGAGDPGAPAPAAPAPVAPSPPYPNPSVPPASPDGGKPADPNFAGISPDDLILNPNDGHLYGFKRTIEVGADGKTVYGYQSLDLGDASSSTALAGIAFNTGIPIGALYMKLQELRSHNAQLTASGYGKLIGYDPTTGLFTYQKPDGTRATTANVSDLGGVGIAPNEIHEAQAQGGTTQRTLTQMGQFTVVGMSQDGTSLTVRDFNGNLSTVSGADAQAGKIPGVSYSDWLNAKSDFVTKQRTLTQAGQFTVDSAQYGPNGELQYNVKDFNGKITTVYGPQLESAVAAGKVPGVTLSDLQGAKYKAVEAAWEQSPVNSNPFFGDGYGNAPTTPPGQQPPAPTPPVPNPAPPPQGGGTPGASPNPLPPYASTPGTPGANPTATPTPFAATSALPGGGTAASSQQAPAGYQGGPAGPAPTGAFGATLSSQQAPAGYKDTSGATVGLTPLSSAQQASYNAYTSTSAVPGTTGGTGPTMMGGGRYSSTMGGGAATGATGATYASTPSTPPTGMTHQQQGLMNQGYQNNLTMTTAQNAGQSRNMSGMGFAGIQPPRVAGYG